MSVKRTRETRDKPEDDFFPEMHYVSSMDRADIIARLKDAEAPIRAQGATALYLYGSHARDEGHANSDVDVFVDVAPGAVLDLSRFMEIHEILQVRLGTKVDYTTRAGLIEFYRPAIEREAVRVF